MLCGLSEVNEKVYSIRIKMGAFFSENKVIYMTILENTTVTSKLLESFFHDKSL